MKHTPKPWYQDGDNVRSKLGIIANVYDPSTPTQHTKMSDANAQLMAAAPELLEACKKARTCATIDSSVMKLLKDVINKAETTA